MGRINLSVTRLKRNHARRLLPDLRGVPILHTRAGWCLRIVANSTIKSA
jgi:hypothetical protein